MATLKGQGDTASRSGLLIPLVVTGSYATPKIRPDLKAMVKKQLASPEELKQLIQGKGEGIGKDEKLEDKAKSLLKGFLN